MENKIEQMEVVKEEVKTQDNSQLFLKSLDEKINSVMNEIKDIKENKFSKNEIKNIAEKNVIEREIKFEEEMLETKRFNDIQLKAKTDLEIRNQMIDMLTDQMQNGEIAPSFYKRAVLGGDNNESQLLGASLFFYLAPNYGVSQEFIRNNSMIQMERDFDRGNNFPNIIRNFKGR